MTDGSLVLAPAQDHPALVAAEEAQARAGGLYLTMWIGHAAGIACVASRLGDEKTERVSGTSAPASTSTATGCGPHTN